MLAASGDDQYMDRLSDRLHLGIPGKHCNCSFWINYETYYHTRLHLSLFGENYHITLTTESRRYYTLFGNMFCKDQAGNPSKSVKCDALDCPELIKDTSSSGSMILEY